MIIGHKGAQDQGKTLVMVRTAIWLMAYGGYHPSECYGNVDIDIDGYHFLSSDDMVDLLTRMVKEEVRHKVILLDEVDRIFPHRFWSSKEQTNALLGLWQDVKLFNYILWTAHLGGAVDLLLRECTQITVIPKYDKLADCVNAEIISNVDMRVASVVFDTASATFPLYNRWAPVSSKLKV